MGLLDLLRRRSSAAQEDEVVQEPYFEQVENASLCECVDRTRVHVRGTLVEVIPGGGDGPRWAEAVLVDGAQRLRLVFMGRHELLGFEVGGQIEVHGMLALRDGERVIYNPYYVLERGFSA